MIAIIQKRGDQVRIRMKPHEEDPITDKESVRLRFEDVANRGSTVER